jgi:pimeloyl-ACP methyl ester carboxylesterase
MRAAIAIGDVDHADDVTILVPGMFYTVAGQMADWTHTAQVLYDAQRAWLKRLGQSSKTVATVAWLGYRTPDLMSVLSLTDAREGATMLEEAVEGIRAARGTHQPYLSIVAHSYGSTAALLAAQDAGTQLDALAVVGSPGSVATSVHELNVPADRVFVGAALLDPIAGSGYFGTDPGSHDYGARPLGAVGGIDPIDGKVMLPAFGHNGYFAPGTESLRNLALIAIGDCSLVTR